jgi:hypothetical protein
VRRIPYGRNLGFLDRINNTTVGKWSANDTVRKVMGSRPNEVNEFFSIYLILPAALGAGVYSASNRNEYQKQENNVPDDQSAAGV